MERVLLAEGWGDRARVGVAAAVAVAGDGKSD
jgi:hypothetical protein